MSECLLCRSKALVTEQEYSSRSIYNCKKCGIYVVSDVAEPEIKRHRMEVLCFVRSRRLMGHVETLLITYDQAELDKGYTQFTIGQIVNAFPHTIAEQMDRALENLARLSEYPGQEVKISSTDQAPLLYLRHHSFEAMSYVVKAMDKAGVIEVNYPGTTFFPCGVTLTPEGWERVEAPTIGGVRQKQAVLVVDHRVNAHAAAVLSAVERVMNENGFALTETSTLSPTKAKTALGYAHIAALRGADVVVCDVDGAQQEAYFAAGFAMAKNVPALLLCHESYRKKLKIDPAQLGVLFWEEEGQLDRMLRNALRAKELIEAEYDET